MPSYTNKQTVSAVDGVNNPATHKDDGWRTRRYVLLFLICVLIPVIIGSVGLALNRSAQVQTHTQAAAKVSRDLAGHIAELETLSSAVLGIHQASSQDSQGNLITLTEQLQQQHPIIEGVGHYSIVPLADRSDFESSMDEQGLYNFHISDITESGRIVSEERPVSMPVSSISPMTPAVLPLLGADLAAHKPLFAELQQATRENRSVVVSLPESWIADKHLLLFNPTYRGIHVPIEQEQRIQQSDGGYLILIDPTALLSDRVKNESALDIEITVSNALGKWSVLTQQAAVETDAIINDAMNTHSMMNSFDLGSAKLELEMTGKVGILLPYFVYTLLAIIALIFWLVLGFLFTENRRKAARERILSQETLYREREKAARTLNAISDAVITVDEDAIIQHVNPAGAKLLNAHSEELSGSAFDEHLPLRHLSKKSHQVHLKKMLENIGDSGRTEYELAAMDDESGDRILNATLSRPADTADHETMFTVILRDVSAELNLRRALEQQANHDALTGCTNRHYFEKRLQDIFENSDEQVNKNALIYIDLDQFKVVNDSAGHRAGDQLLINLTNRINKVLRDGDTLSRIGGDEFGVIVSDVDEKQARDVGETVFNTFENFIFVHESHSFPITASLGLVHFSETQSTTTDVLAAADLACYAAKDGGRNQLFVYSANDKTMAERSEELNWLGRLRLAFEQESFRLHVQPLANLNLERQITHFEFLLRLEDESGQEVTPWQIIKAAERYDLMRDLDRWIINHALELIASLGNIEGVAFSINLSGQSAADSTLPKYIQEKYAEHKVNPASVCFEITETAAISNLSTAIELIECIQSLGSKVALDDFGSGLSSFGYLKNLPVDILKIDGQFVVDLAENKVDRAMVKAIHDVAESMGLKTVAEYVETLEIVKVLEEIGIDYAQGYYIGKPQPLDLAFDDAFGDLMASTAIAA